MDIKYKVGRAAVKTLIEAALTSGVEKKKVDQYLSLHGRGDFLLNSKNKYASWALFNDIFQEFIKTIEKQGFNAFELAAYYGINGENISTYKNYVRSSWGTHYLYKLQEKIIFKLLFPFVTMKILHLSKDKVIIRKSVDQEVDGIENLWKFYKEVYKFFPNILGSKVATVDMVAGPTECYLLVSLSKGKSSFSKIPFSSNNIWNKIINIKKIFKSEKDIIRDLVEFKSELEEVNKELHKKNSILDDQLILKSELLDIFSHDTNNSLHIINFYSNSILKYEDEKIRDKAQKLLNHTKKLEEVLSYIRDFNKGLGTITASHGVLASTLIEQTLDKFTETTTKKNILFDIKVEEDFEIFINDRAFTHSVLGNLVSNSIKFSPEGSMILIEALKGTSDFIFNVRDYGIGMSQAEVKLYCENNSRWSTKGTMGEVGTGIGSRICRSLVKRMNGRIEVNSSDVDTEDFLKGTEVSVILPLSLGGATKEYRELEVQR